MPAEKQNLTKNKGQRYKKSPDQIKQQTIQEQIKNLKAPQQHKFFCTACKQESAKIDEFPRSNSDLYIGNDYRLPICLHCLNALYYKIEHDMKYTDYHDTFNHVCMLYDIYYNSTLADMAIKECRQSYVMSKYITKTGLNPHGGKTYSDTIKERLQTQEELYKKTQQEITLENAYIEIPEKDKEMWGDGLSLSDYNRLNVSFKEWSADHACETKAQKSILKNICYVELQIYNAIRANEDTSKLTKQFNDLLGSGNLQPRQSKEETINDQITFGTLINKWENEKPIPEPLPEFKDVDNIIHYISVWFLGHLCKMVGLKNSWSKMYVDEISKYTVHKPEYENDEDGSKRFEDIFGGDI